MTPAQSTGSLTRAHPTAPPSSPRLDISRALRHEIESSLADAYPREACGFILGRARRGIYLALELLPAPNRELENPYHRYRLDRSAYQSAEATAIASDLEILGLYHGHPDSDPIPSSIDSDFAFPGWIYWGMRVSSPTSIERARAKRAGSVSLISSQATILCADRRCLEGRA